MVCGGGDVVWCHGDVACGACDRGEVVCDAVCDVMWCVMWCDVCYVVCDVVCDVCDVV